ncbi:MAG TPA: hypothetical protein VH351_19655 [Bryobacteraceae bacterium]|nr:hypothetical protein [Bryobacteraceae bacterium]
MGRAVDPKIFLAGHTTRNVLPGQLLVDSWMKRPLGLSDPSSATATVVLAPSGTDVGWHRPFEHLLVTMGRQELDC